MPEIHAIHTSSTLHRTIVNGEHYTIAPTKWYHLGPGLHSRALLRHDELATIEVPTGLREEDRQLQREDMFSIEVLVQAVVIACTVLQ
jgi:hypothetical protein